MPKRKSKEEKLAHFELWLGLQGVISEKRCGKTCSTLFVGIKLDRCIGGYKQVKKNTDDV